MKAEADSREAARLEEVASLKTALAEATSRSQQLDSVLSEWEAAVAARDEEIRNLQVLSLTTPFWPPLHLMGPSACHVQDPDPRGVDKTKRL
jgi:hypothetical protein